MSSLRDYLSFLFLVLLIFFCSCKGDVTKQVSSLTVELSAKDSGVRNKACLKLASLGGDAKASVPSLIKLLRDPNNGVRSSAAYALRSIGGDKAEAALLQYEKEDDK